jgi:hypothetical protein
LAKTFGVSIAKELAISFGADSGGLGVRIGFRIARSTLPVGCDA